MHLFKEAEATSHCDLVHATPCMRLLSPHVVIAGRLLAAEQGQKKQTAHGANATMPCVQAASGHRPKSSPRRMLLPETLPGWDTRPPTRAGGGARPPPWAALTEAVAELLDGIWCGKQRLFVRHFVFQAGARRTTPLAVPHASEHLSP